MINFLKTPDELSEVFNLTDLKEYYDYIKFSDGTVGFSIKRKYPENFRYNPPKNKKNEPDVISLIRIIYDQPNGTDVTIQPNRISLKIKFANYSQYLANHFDYNFSDEDCPTRESIKLSKRTLKPFSLEFIDEFYYDHKIEKIIDKNGKSLTGEYVLNYVFKRHCDTIHLFKGFILKFKIRTHNILISLLRIIIFLCKLLINKLLGREIIESNNVFSYFEGYTRKDLKKLKTDSINLFGYKAPKQVILTFCFTILILKILWPNLFEIIFPNPLFYITNAILILAFLDNIMPLIFLWLLNKLIKIRNKHLFKKIRF